jgi:hypothetical protein
VHVSACMCVCENDRNRDRGTKKDTKKEESTLWVYFCGFTMKKEQKEYEPVQQVSLWR